MSVLLSCQTIAKSHGSRTLFERISFTVSEGDRIGLIGPNGSGKSTLLRILSGEETIDDGVVSIRKQLRTGFVAQESTFPEGLTVLEVLTEALPAPHSESDNSENANSLNAMIGRAGFTDPAALAGTLSGGWAKRLAIAAELLRNPDLLLLDEPTNHLDLGGIVWLEKLLRNAPFASLIVSHDRYFLENCATRMMEIHRSYPDGLFAVNGNYSEFLIKKDEFLHAQAKRQEALENRVEREIEWLRRGAKARSTKSKARIDSAGRMIEELGDMNARAQGRTAGIDFSATDRRTKRLIDAEKVSKSMGGRTLFRDLSFVLGPGTRLGLLGPNGSGKSTLLRMITGELNPDSGQVKRADLLRVVYFDQNREQLDPRITLRRAMAPHGDSVIYQDRPIHVAAWSSRFLFQAEQLELPVGSLSGGEQARVLIARLMLQPADVLLLDEPTNDLDIPTLEVLEESLLEFPGALVLVTHDRYLLDRVSTVIIGLDGEGGSGVYADCSQWEKEQSGRKSTRESAAAAKPAPPSKRKLSYHESREWEQMETRIAAAEDRVRAAQTQLENPDGMADAATVQARYAELQAAQQDVDALYARWVELESALAELAK